MMGRRAFVTGMAGVVAAPLSAGPRPVPRPISGSGWAGAASDALIAASGLSGRVGYALVEPGSGLLIEGAGQDIPLPPASTMKTLTALYALARLGMGHRFRTRLLVAGPVRNGRIEGDLVLAGGGDPVLDSDDLDALAAALIARGIAGVTGRFLIWGGALPARDQIADGQPAHVSYNPAVSGLMLNFNRVHLEWRRNAGRYDLAMDARADTVAPRAYTVSAAVAARDIPVFAYESSGPHEHWTVARPALGRAGSRWLPVRRPLDYAGDVFQTLARARGLGLPAPEAVTDLPAAQEIAAHDSPVLAEILHGMLEYSTNLTAEAVGLAASGAGDQLSSARMMQDWIWAQAPLGEAVLRDHSGLSAGSRISPYGMALALAIGAQGSGLSALLRDQPLVDAKGREYRPQGFGLRAKTGTLNFVSNLCGYLTTQSGRQLVFVIFSRDEARRNAAAQARAELPPGAGAWVRRAKQLQSLMIEGWAARY